VRRRAAIVAKIQRRLTDEVANLEIRQRSTLGPTKLQLVFSHIDVFELRLAPYQDPVDLDSARAEWAAQLGDSSMHTA